MQINTSKYFLAIISLILGLGIVLMSIGITVGRDSTIGQFLFTFSGSLTGMGLGGLLTELFFPDAFRRLGSAIHSALGPGLSSDEALVAPLRRRYHHYYMTKSHGRKVWQYGVVNFSGAASPGKLLATATYVDKNNKKVIYDVQGGVFGNRLVITIALQQAAEEPDICIFPFMRKLSPTYRCGFGIRECWDYKHVLAPDILIEQPISGWTRMGTVDDETSRELQKFWVDGIQESVELLPMSTIFEENNAKQTSEPPEKND